MMTVDPRRAHLPGHEQPAPTQPRPSRTRRAHPTWRATLAAAVLALGAACGTGDEAVEDGDPLVDPDDRTAPDAADPDPEPTPGEGPVEDEAPEFDGPDPEPDAGEQDAGP